MKRYALVVGIGDYDHLPNLSKPKTDAEAMRDVLQANNHFEVTLLNEGVTREELRNALETLLLKRGKNSDVLIYFTGHGFTAGEDEDEAQGYLATQDCRIEVEGKRVLSVRKGFSFQSLNGLIAKAELSSLVMLLDCCHGGSFIESAQAREKLGALNKARYCLVTACRSFEQAAAMKSAEHSIFSAAVLAALRADGEQVTALDLMHRVEQDLRGTGQEPVYVGAGSDVPILERRQVAAAQSVSEECPYQGLNAFTSETKEVFFGRDADVDLLAGKLANSNFVPVLGPSGSGKSSVVRAGLVSALEAQGWRVVMMKPDDQPLANLRAAMGLLWSDLPMGERRRLGELLKEEGGLLAVAREWPGEERVLLLVDQFEEVFTQCAEGKEKERDSFIWGLVAVGQVDTRLAIVMTMRSDFVDEWLKTGQPPEVIQQDTVWLGSLKGENLRSAIEEPARLRGYGLEPGLLRSLLRDVEREENCLPLLEFALTELWAQRDENSKKLTVAAYDEMGGLEGALDRRATVAYEKLREADRAWAKRVFLQLVRIGRGEKDTRQRQPKELLLSMGGSDNQQNKQSRQMIADVIADLAKGRLLVTNSGFGAELGGNEEETDSVGYVDLAHEALLEGWAQFVQWRKGDRDVRRLVQRLEDAYEEWRKKGDDYLLTGGLLLELKEQWNGLKEILSEKRRPELEVFFLASAKREQQTVSELEQALAETRLQEECSKVRDKLQYASTRIVDSALTAIELVGESQKEFGQVVHSVKDTLHRSSNSLREQLKLKGHRGDVWSVAFSKEGDKILSASGDKSIRLWDLQGNFASKPFIGHAEAVRAAAFHPYKDLIVSGSSDKTLRLWDFEGNSIGQPFIGHTASVLSVAFSPDGERVISASRDKTLRLWDLKGNVVSEPFIGHTDSVLSVAFSPNGKRIVSSSVDRTLRLWNLKGKYIGNPFCAHTNSVLSVAFSPDGNRIVSGGNDKNLLLWNLKGEQIGRAFSGHTAAVRAVAFNPDGDVVASGSFDSTVRIWNLRGDVVGKPLVGHSDAVLSVAFSPEGNKVISGSSDQTIRAWRFENAAIDQKFSSHNGSIREVAFSEKNSQIASASEDKTIRLWDLQGNTIGQPFVGHTEYVLSVAFSPDGEKIISAGSDKLLRLWDLDGNLISPPFSGHSGSVRSVAFSPKGDCIVSGSNDKMLRLWNLQSQMICKPFKGHADEVWSVAFSANSQLIVSGSTDKTVRLWDLEGHTVKPPFRGHTDGVVSVAFSPNGDRIVSGSRDRTVRLWDLEGNPIGEPFSGHSSSVSSVAFSPDGKWIVSSGNDKTIRIWDLYGNYIDEPFFGHTGAIWSARFSPKGDWIASGGVDSAVWLWRIGDWRYWLRHCCNMLMHHTALTLPQTETACKACEVCEQVWTRSQSAEFLVAQGSAIARTGEVDKAISKFNRAKELNPELTLDSAARANQLAEWG